MMKGTKSSAAAHGVESSLRKRSSPGYVVKSGGHTVEVVGRSVFEQLGFTPRTTLELLGTAVDEVLCRRN